MDQEQGMEIALSSASQAKLQKRLERTNPRMVGALPGNHEGGVYEQSPPRLKVRVKTMEDASTAKSSPSTDSSLPPEVLKYHQEEELASKRFRYIVYSLLVLCLAGVIAAVVLAAKAGNKHNSKANLSEKAANNNGNIDKDVLEQGSPSMTPTMFGGSIADSSTTAPTAPLVTNVRSVMSQYAFGQALSRSPM